MTSEDEPDWDDEARMLRDGLLGAMGKPCKTERSLDGAEVFLAGEPPEVVVRLTPDMVSVSRYELTWSGPHDPRATPRLMGSIRWRTAGAHSAMVACEMLIRSAREQRRATFRKCKYCGDTFGPEHMHSGDVCQGCAEEHLGIVH